MNTGTSSTILSTLLSGLLSGIVVALLNYLLTRKKTQAEIKKMEAETEKIRIEISKLGNISATVSYNLVSSSTERIIYDSSQREIGYDFEGSEDFIWTTVDGKPAKASERGEGTLNFEKGGVLNIKRTNTEGRYQVWLLRYIFDGVEKPNIAKDELISGRRNLRLSCEAKVVGGEHTLKFVLKNEQTDRWLATEARRVTENTWSPLSLYFRIPANEECRLRLDDLEVSKAPSSIQIRNLVLAEKVS